MPLSKMQKADSCWGSVEPRYEKTAQLISAFVFATRIVQHLFFLNPKFQASGTARFISDLVGSPEDRFSHNEAQFIS